MNGYEAMTPEEELNLRRHVHRIARRLGLLRGKGWFCVRPLTERRGIEAEPSQLGERECLDAPGCSRAFNPAGLR